MIGHLSARMIGRRPGIELDLDAIVEAAERTGTALEVNGSLPRLDLSLDALRRVRDRRVDLVLTSDAHHIDELERVRFASLHAERAWVDPSRFVNVGSTERLLDWTRRKQPALA
jgi:DNA polymerase (family 10)